MPPGSVAITTHTSIIVNISSETSRARSGLHAKTWHLGYVRRAPMETDRDARDIHRARRRLWAITALLGVWIALGTVAYWAARGYGPLDALYTTIETLGYLSRRQEGAALVVQLVLLHGGTVITWYIGWVLVDLVMDQHFTKHRRERKRM